MSAFLGFESFLIPLGSTVQNVQDTLKTAITSYGWQCTKQSLAPVATLGTFGSPGNVFDYNNTTIVSETNSLPKWVGVQMTNPFTPINMIIQIRKAAEAPKDFTLDWSDNGTVWTTHQSWTGENNWWAYREVRSFSVIEAPAKLYWRLNVTARSSGTTTAITGLWLEDSLNNQISTDVYGFFIPPVTETIGNSVSRELVCISTTSSAIYINPRQELLSSLPQLNSFYNATAGAVTLSITINSVTVSYTGLAGNTALQNARGLFEALYASTDANFLAWEWKWTNSLLGLTNNYSYFLATKKIPANNISITTSNIATTNKGVYAQPQIQQTGFTYSYIATIDLINGFIYYLQVNARGIALATKTNAGFYGPFHACYGSNTDAIAQIPTNDHELLPLTPIELVVGYDDSVNNTGGLGKITHWWVSFPDAPRFGLLNPDCDDQSCNVFTKHAISGYITDAMGSSTSIGDVNVVMRAEGLFCGGDTGTMYNIHRLSMVPDPLWQDMYNSNTNGRGLAPVLTGLDWYRYVGSLASEQLILAASTDFTTAMTATASATDVTLTVASTTGFPDTGYIIIDGEVIQYAGKTPTSFTGCTRGKYSTSPMSQLNGTLVCIAMWLVKINTGLLLAGYQKPV